MNKNIIDEKMLLSKLQHRYIDDLRKDELDAFERAAVIMTVCKSEQLSIRGFANKYNFKRSTVDDWVRIGNLSEEKVKELKDAGVKDTAIYHALRKGIDVDSLKELADLPVKEIKNMNNKNDRLEINTINNFVEVIDNIFRNRTELIKLSKDSPKEFPNGYTEKLNEVSNTLRKIGMYLKKNKH